MSEQSEPLHVINTITVPAGMESVAEETRATYVEYFRRQEGFVSSTFFKAKTREADGSIRYVNTVVWVSQDAFDRVVNKGFSDENGENADGMRVLGKGFLPPIGVSPGQFIQIA